MHVQKRRRSGGYVEAFVHVLSDSEASETYGYLVWVILASSKSASFGKMPNKDFATSTLS